MSTILFSVLLSGLSTNALAAPLAVSDLGAPAQELSLSVRPQLLGAGPSTSLRMAAGSADRLDLADGRYDLEDEDGNPYGRMDVRPDGSIVVSGPAVQHSGSAHARAVTVAEVYNYSDGDCTYTSIYIGWSDGTGSWSFYDDCAIEVR